MRSGDAFGGKFAWSLERPGVMVRVVLECACVKHQKRRTCPLERLFLTIQHTGNSPIQQRVGS